VSTDTKGNGVAGLPTWRYIVRLARYRPWLYLTSGLLASVMFYLFPLLPGLVVKRVFDKLTGEATVSLGLWALLALLAAIALARQSTIIGAVAAEVSLRLIVSTLLRKNLLARILKHPGARAVPTSPGEAISRFRDDVAALPNFLSWTLDPVGQLLVTVIGLSVLASINARLTLAVFIPLMLTLVVVNLAGTRIERYRKANQEAIGAVTNLLGEMFGAVQAVKIAGTRTHIIDHFRRVNEARRRATLQDLLFSRLLESLSTNSANLATGVLLLVLAGMVRGRPGTESGFSVGDFSLFVSYLGWLATVTNMFGNYLTLYRQTGVSLARLLELLPGASPSTLVAHGPVHLWGELPSAFPYRQPLNEKLEILTATGLSYHYPGTEYGVVDATLSIPQGTFTVITGRVGSGKSTLLKVLLGLLPKDAGEIRWNGVTVDNPANFFVPPRSAYTGQVPRLFNETLRDNILMGLPEDDVNLPTALHTAVMERDVTTLEEGLDTPVGPRGTKLSGGQVQRAAAARMFVREPELLVFDDLSSALDVETERTLWERVLERECTCLAVSHRRSVLRQADCVILLKEGRVEATGSIEDLLSKSEEMRRLWVQELETQA
jgi:ATP-binding cassette subfamily B protein